MREKKKIMIKVGDKINVWWNAAGRYEEPHNNATVLDVLPYTGKYKESFNCVLRLSAPSTYRGYIEMAYRAP